jgi:hypothetical protein
MEDEEDYSIGFEFYLLLCIFFIGLTAAIYLIINYNRFFGRL